MTSRSDSSSRPADAVTRFTRSMAIDYEKWHDGIGYDLAAIDAATPAERAAIEALLLARGGRDWRDVEALARLATPAAERALAAIARDAGPAAAVAVLRHAPHVVDDPQRTACLVAALGSASFGDGLSATLDQVAAFHPPAVIAALLRGCRDRAGDVAVHYAAMLLFIHGRAESSFDLAQRPFLLRFNTADARARAAALADLRARIGVEPEAPGS